MPGFDSVYKRTAVPALQHAMGTVPLVYSSRSLTRTVDAIRPNAIQTLVQEMGAGDIGTEVKQEIITFHVPTDADVGIPSPDMMAILECEGKRYSIQSIGDWSGSMATITAVRSLGYDTTTRRKL